MRTRMVMVKLLVVVVVMMVMMMMMSMLKKMVLTVEAVTANYEQEDCGGQGTTKVLTVLQ